MLRTRIVRCLSAAALPLALAFGSVSPAINVVIDYTYDSYGFFNPATTQGQQARASLEAAAGFLSDILEDSFVPVEAPPDYISTSGPFSTTYSWDWEIRFTNPGGSNLVVIDNPTIAQDEFRIYVGAKELGGNTLGTGGPGGFSSSSGGGYYTNAQLQEILAIDEAFSDALNNRGQGAGDYGRWGGVLSFDTTTDWNYNHLVDPTSNQSDFYSVALHELVHTTGIGVSSQSTITEWQALVTPDQQSFSGSESVAVYGGLVPLNPDADHWQEGLQSAVFGGTEMQEVLMDPTITRGTTKELTSLDAAGLIDLGWEITQPTPPSFSPGDFNADGKVDNNDLNLLLSAWGDSPQPPGWLWDFEAPVDNGELNSLLANWGFGTSTAVPEPSMLVLSLLAACGWRRR